MARGSISKRCTHGVTGIGGKDACRVRHGSWNYVLPIGRRPDGRTTYRRESGFPTRDDAQAALTAELARIDAAAQALTGGAA